MTAAVRPVDERDERLAELRAKRAELQRQREAREARYAADDEVEAEERGLRDEQAIADAEERIGRVGKMIATIDTDLGVVILKRAHQATMRRFMERAEDLKTEDLIKLVRPSLVYPSGPEFDVMLDAQPMVLHRCSKALGVLAGLRVRETAEK
jgi:hypothetical protein